MSEERLSFLIRNYFAGSLDDSGEAELFGLLSEQGFDTGAESLMPELYDGQLLGGAVLLGDKEREQVLATVLATAHRPKGNHIGLWKKWAAVAAMLLVVLSVGIWIYGSREKGMDLREFAAKSDVEPGRQGATLTLADGRKIRLADAADGELAKQAGIVIRKTADGQLVYELEGKLAERGQRNSVATARGETYQLRLPDGSMVWLNAESRLSYNAGLVEAGKRLVELEGEGYFEVAKDAGLPFVVKTAGQEVRVLGTHFNVNAYVDEPSVKTTLLEGSVRVSAGVASEQVLKPGEQASLLDGKLRVQPVVVDDVIAWKEGFIVFDGERLEEVMKEVSRWYGVEVAYGDAALKDKRFSGSVSRQVKLSQVLRRLELVGGLSFGYGDGKLIVDRNRN